MMRMQTRHVVPHRYRIALVTPWFGAQLKGGAEQLAWQLATRLSATGHRVDVLTTCNRSFQDDWSVNHFEPSAESGNGYFVRRFSVDARNASLFDAFNGELLGLKREDLGALVRALPLARSAVWVTENINSSALVDHIRACALQYDIFLFLPYLYGVVINGITAAGSKAVVQPCLHDEAYAYLPAIRDSFASAKALLCNSDGERELVSRIYGGEFDNKTSLVGSGIELNLSEEYVAQGNERLLPEPLRSGEYVLCLGRRDTGKGVDFLCESFRHARHAGMAPNLTLVLAGSGAHSYSDAKSGILDLGLVDENLKRLLLQHCRALCQPSTNESFSRVIFEAWFFRKPVIVHGHCEATKQAVQASNGGFIATTELEWSNIITTIANTSSESLAEVGQQGNAYAGTVADWGRCIDRYNAVFHSVVQSQFAVVNPAIAVHQVLPNLNPGDAISNQVRLWRDWLRAMGFKSDIYVMHVHPAVQHEVIQVSPEQIAQHIKSTDAVLYHHSIGSALSTAIVAAGISKRQLVYHNITPPEFFAGYSPHHEYLCRTGREEMWALARQFKRAVGDSQYNVDELIQFGFDSPLVLPLAVPPSTFMSNPTETKQGIKPASITQVLFVGRIAPNKRQIRIVEVFATYLALDPTAHLHLVGSGAPGDAYFDALVATVERHQILNSVTIVGHVDDETLANLFATASLFLCLSEHEGFCVPLVEAMWLDVPILALNRAAIGETMGAGSTFLLSDEDATGVAFEMYRMVHSSAARMTQLQAQRLSRERFRPERVKPQFEAMIQQLLECDVTSELGALA